MSVLGIVTLGSELSPRVGFIGRVFEPDGWTGSEEDVQIDLTVVEAEPEE